HPPPGGPARRAAPRPRSRSAWRSPRGLSRGAPLERAHGLRDDPPVVLVPQALPDQLLGDGGREIAHLTPQLVTRPSAVGLELDPRALDEAVGLCPRGLRGERARGQPEQRDGRERDAPPPPANAFTHAEVSCAGLSPVGL